MHDLKDSCCKMYKILPKNGFILYKTKTRNFFSLEHSDHKVLKNVYYCFMVYVGIMCFQVVVLLMQTQIYFNQIDLAVNIKFQHQTTLNGSTICRAFDLTVTRESCGIRYILNTYPHFFYFDKQNRAYKYKLMKLCKMKPLESVQSC